MRRNFSLVAKAALATALTVVIFGCGGQSAHQGQVVGLGLRTVVASAGLGKVDAYTNNVLQNSNMASADSSPTSDRPFNQVQPGTYTLSLHEAGSAADLLSTSVTGVEGEFIHAIAFGTKGQATDPPRFMVIRDQRSSFDTAYANLRVVNGAKQYPDIDVYITEATSTVPLASEVADLTNVTFENVSDMVKLTGARWRFRFTRAGTKDVIYDETMLTGSNTYGVLLLLPDSTGTGLDVVPYGSLL